MHVYYTGRVQGVGFRHTVEGLALEIGLSGWVKNLPDGCVEILGEGSKADLDLFMKRIRESAVGPYIRKADCDWGSATGEFGDFTVEFYI